ncbi:unnamed protein product, partial [Mesorhabditis belari]|uniref:Uncharacterized protein n=1 Tax=Mesorhabditis belari TaxID=2138241 RepID=A0AAF3JB88_9BILA
MTQTGSSLLDFLHAQRFRNLLLEAHNGSSIASNQVRDVVRLLSAFFLDLPLFLPESGEALPTLFVWCELKRDDLGILAKSVLELDVALPPSTHLIDRFSISQSLSHEFGPKSPIIIFVHLGLPLEAILYADHFSDVRSGLILRIFADSSFGFSLTTDHIYYLLHEGIPEEVDRLLEKASSLTNDEIEKFCKTIAKSVLELDVVLGTSRTTAFELFLLGKIEFLFARLSVHSKNLFAKTLPRPPVYLLPNVPIGSPKKGENEEISAHWHLYIYLNILLECLHAANRLQYEMEQVRAILAQYDTQFQPHILSSRGAMRVISSSSQIPPRLLRALLLSLRFTYRDLFSQALAMNWADSQMVAKKYKTLLQEEKENSEETIIQSFFSVADEADLEHITTFLRFVEEKFSPKTTLPSYCLATREIWLEHLFEEKKEGPIRGEDEGEWLRGHIRIEHKVPQPIISTMSYLSTTWTSLPKTDRSLIAITLQIHPKDLCVAKQMSPRSRSNVPIVRGSLSFDQPFALAAMGPSTSTYFERPIAGKDLISEYAAKGSRLLGKGYLPRSGPNATQIAARKRLDERMRRMAETQRELEREVDSETSFLSQLGSITERPRAIEKSPLSDGDLRGENSIKLEEAGKMIQTDLQILSKRLENFTKLFCQRKKRSSIDSANTSITESTKEEENESDLEKGETFIYPSISNRNKLEVEDEEETFQKEEIDQVISNLPPIERLDFSKLSPPPTVGRRVFSTKITQKDKDKDEDEKDIEEIPVYTPVDHFTVKGSLSERSARRQRKLGRIEAADRILDGKWKESKKKEIKKVENWMRLLPLGGTTSERGLPLLRVENALLYDNKAKTSRGVQTRENEATKFTVEAKICSRPDSGIDGSPSNLPSIPFVRAMSKEDVAELIASKKKSDESIIYASVPLSHQPSRTLVEAASPLDSTQRSKLEDSPMHFPQEMNKSPSNPLRPRELWKTEKEQLIKEEGLKCKKSDYPTVDDIMSDWSSERENKKSRNKALPVQNAENANNRST